MGHILTGGRDVILDAGRDLNIVAAQNTGGSQSKSESGGGGVGVKAVAGSNGVAFGINVEAHAAGSKGNDYYNSHTNAQITAGDILYTHSGRDTNIAGAHLEGDKVWMDVGGDLNVSSLQDSYESKSQSWNAGIDVTVGYGVNVSGNVGYGQGKADSSWVGEQTSIIGRSEVDIYVEDNTHLKGAIIATDKGGDLTLNTGTLTYEEIHDKNKSTDWQAGISGGFSIGGVGFDKPEKGHSAFDTNPMDFMSENGSILTGRPYVPKSVEYTSASSDKQGVLRPTVTDGEIIVRDNPDADLAGLNRNIDDAREITKEKETYVDFYIDPALIIGWINGTQLNDHETDAEKYGFIANLLPGLFINKSITGQETRTTDDRLEYRIDPDTGEWELAEDVPPYIMSDDNPFLQTLYLVPGVKSLSEIHDIQMKQYQALNDGQISSLYTVFTLPSSFAKKLYECLD